MNRVGLKSSLIHIYDKHYKKLLVFSVLLLIASVGVLMQHKMATGEFVSKGVSLKGGLTLTIPDEIRTTAELQHSLAGQFPAGDVSVRSIADATGSRSLIVEASDVAEEDLLAALVSEGLPMQPGTYSLELMGSSLGESFYRQTIIAVLVAFLFMAIVVFITFRSPLPSAFVILAAASEIISTLAVIDLLGVKISTAGVAALLMIIGYSSDTNILLTAKVLKHKGAGVFERILTTMRTGILMTLTAFAGTMVGYFVTQSDIVKQIMLIISIGLALDLVYTWFQNAGILRWYMEREHKKHGERHG